MRKILTILYLLISIISVSQDIKPIDPVNFKALQSPSFSYFVTDSTVWIYKGAQYGWTKLTSERDVLKLINNAITYYNDTVVCCGIEEAPINGISYVRKNGAWTPASGGSASVGIWTALTGTYASATTFTFSGTDTDAKLVEMSLLTCTNSAGTTRRIGYVKTATNSSGTITCNVVTDTDLASGDKDFKVAYNRKVNDYEKLITLPGECIGDESYSQGMFYTDIPTASYLLPVDASVLTAAAGTGAALTFNVYKGATNLFSAAPDMSTNTVLRSQRPTTNTISAADNVSLRILSSAGATNKAADFQAKLYIVPQSLFTAFGMNCILIIGLILVFFGGSLIEIRFNKKILFILIIFCSLQGFGQIKGYWRLNGNSNDASGGGNNGTDTGITYSQSDGRLNQGANFNATSDKILIANESNFDFERTQALTVSCWFKLNTVNALRFLVTKQVAGGNYNGWSLWLIYNPSYGLKIDFNLVSTPTNLIEVLHLPLTTTSDLVANKWYNIIVTYDGSSSVAGVNMYLNGKKLTTLGVVTNTLTTSILNNTQLELGNRNGAFNFNGSMDEVIVDNTEWSPAKVKNEYLRVKGFFQN